MHSKPLPAHDDVELHASMGVLKSTLLERIKRRMFITRSKADAIMRYGQARGFNIRMIEIGNMTYALLIEGMLYWNRDVKYKRIMWATKDEMILLKNVLNR